MYLCLNACIKNHGQFLQGDFSWYEHKAYPTIPERGQMSTSNLENILILIGSIGVFKLKWKELSTAMNSAKAKPVMISYLHYPCPHAIYSYRNLWFHAYYLCQSHLQTLDKAIWDETHDGRITNFISSDNLYWRKNIENTVLANENVHELGRKRTLERLIWGKPSTQIRRRLRSFPDSTQLYITIS